MWGPTKKMHPIGSSVSTFIGYKQTDMQSMYVDDKSFRSYYVWNDFILLGAVLENISITDIKSNIWIQAGLDMCFCRHFFTN